MDLLGGYEDDDGEDESRKASAEPVQQPYVPQETYSTEESDIEVDEDDEVDNNDSSNEKKEEYNDNSDAPRAVSYGFSGYSSSSSSSAAMAQAPENTLDAYIRKKKIPVSNQVDLGGHSKAVSCFSFEPTGNRLVSGSLDYTVRLFDFGGMDSRHRSFKSLEAQEGHMVCAISHSPSGDRFVVGTGSAQPKVYDRDGGDIIKFVRGDMYLRDLANTKGHTMEVTGLAWHPSEKNTILSSSLDGSLRIWDLLGEAAFGCLMNKHVLKIRPAAGQQRLGATCCCYSPNGLKAVAGTSDGSIHIWLQKKQYSRPDVVLRSEAHSTRAVTGVVVSGDNQTVAARYEGGVVMLWNSARPKDPPLKVFNGLPNDYPTANVEFSPDSSLLCCGTSPAAAPSTGNSEGSSSSSSSSGGETGELKSRLYFFEVEGVSTAPAMHIAVAAGVSAIMVRWQPHTNQIFCSLSSGAVRVLYDPQHSKKGALLSAHKVPKREKDPSDYAITGEIQNPNALPMYRTEVDVGLKRKMELKDPVRARIPYQPPTQGPGTKENTSFFFTNYVMSERKADTSRTEDPREALLRVDREAKADPMFLGKAYQTSQPRTVMHSLTAEQEQEEFKKKQRDALK